MFVEREEPEQLFGLFHSAEIYVATKGFTSLTDYALACGKLLPSLFVSPAS